jgi:hypothetical protein
MQKEIELKVPTSYADITLRKWLAMSKDMVNYKDEEEAVTALMFMHLCGLDLEYTQKLSVESYNTLKAELLSFMNNTDLPLQRIVTIGGIEYGFEPNLSEMAYGAYSDITAFKNLTIDDNWSKIMSILYRPVTNKRKSGLYSIKTYDGKMEHEKFLDVPMDVHFGALFFFVHLSMDLLNSTLNSMTQMEFPANLKQILERSGTLMQQSYLSPMETLLKSMK